MEQTKKVTKAQLEKRIKNAIIHVDRTHETKTVFFDDKGLRLTVTEDYAIIETGFHRHVYNSMTQDGVSRPYLYTQRMVEIALDNNAWVKDEKGDMHYSYSRLLEVLKAKTDQSEYNIATYYDWWLFILFNPVYAISETEANMWLVYFKYVQALAVNSIFLEEHTEDITNKMFINKFKMLIDEFTKDIDERVVLHKLTDEEFIKQELDAMQQDENDKVLQQQLQNEALKEENKQANE